MVLVAVGLLLHTLFAPKCTTEIGMAFYRSVDADNNGRVDIKEALNHFKKYDVNGDNSVSPDEAAERVAYVDPELQAYKDLVFDILDINKSGHITRSDYKEIINFMDDNNNKEVDAGEAVEFLKAFCGTQKL